MHKNKIKEKCKIPDMRKLSDNFYLLIRKEKTWNKDEIKLIRKYLNYKIFYPIPKSFIDVAKYGWRFGSSNFDYFKKKENIVAKYIEKLNDINKKYKITKKMYLLYERDELLSKYFDKYMDDYYSDRKMIDYKLYNKDIKDYLLKNTLHLQRFNLRFDGYPMYLDCR
jgi:hypothetical protein